MGVVYKAEDTALERPVALKFLAEHLLNNEEAKARFLREAKAAAALHHPNVCPVYEIAEVEGKTFLALAFLKGETLEDRIAKGPLAIKDALDIGRQIAEGLEAAHEAGIVHRDIKPANVLVDSKGHATIMDFGLARLTEASRLTKADQAMGTVAYMSPEQAQGQEVDSRTDIWALGCVLYEMVSGQRPFLGQYDQALFYEIVQQEPAPLTSIRAGVPMELEFTVGKCLAKGRDDRTESAREVARELRTLSDKLKSGRSTILKTGDLTTGVPAAMSAPQSFNPAESLPPDAVIVRKRRLQAAYAVAALFGIAFLGLLTEHFTAAPPQRPLRRFSLVPPPGIDAGAITAGPVISPDGEHIAFTTTGSEGLLWVQDLDQEEPRTLAGTEGAILRCWSPDSRFIAYAAGAELRKVSVEGGASGIIYRLPTPQYFEGTWSPDGDSIVFAAMDMEGAGISLYEVPSQGGDPTVLVGETDLNGARGYVSRPRFLPPASGRALLFTLGDVSQGTLYAKNLDTGQLEELGPGDRPVYSLSSGLVIYQSQRSVYDLWARPFSLATLQFTGTAFPVRENARQPSISADGTLAYLDGDSTTKTVLRWVDRAGQAQTGRFIDIGSRRHPAPAISPDGRSLAYRQNTGVLWVQDISRGSRVRLSESAAPGSGLVWSPNGGRVAFTIADAGGASAVVRAADGSGETVRIVDGPGES